MKLFDDSFDIFNDEIESAPSPEIKIVSVSMDGTKSGYKSLEDLLETDPTIKIDESFIDNDQAKLPINETVMSNMAYFGSVYAIISYAIDNIKTNYPNGFAILSATTGTTSLMFNSNNVYMYGSVGLQENEITKYSLYELSGSDINNIFTIETYTTGLTYMILYLDGQPVGGDCDYIVSPTDQVIKPFFASLSDYEKALLEPPIDKDNYWPRDSIVNNILICEGSSYNTFINTELTQATLIDNETTEIMWRKLYPEGQKILDSDTQLAYKLVSTYARNFDEIKKYQDAISDLHTIGYENYNHIPDDLVLLLANQWNWSLARDLNQSDLSTYIYPTFDNYVTGYSQQLISGKDVDFERWRRILANLVYLYKRKGTESCLRMFANIYGIPERLFTISEIIENIDGRNSGRYIVAPSKIVVHTDAGERKYVIPTTGEIKDYPYPGLRNTKYLELNLDPIGAIEYEFYDWGWGDHDGVENVNGEIVSFSGLSQPDETLWYENIIQNLIPSDGYARYNSSYPLLENEGIEYYNNAATPWSLTTLEPYIDFLDDNWAVIAEKLLPASTKVLSTGTLYRNQFWNRQKHIWNTSELSAKTLPFNEEVPLDFITPVITKINTNDANISLLNLTSNKTQKLEDEIIPLITTGSKEVTLSDEVNIMTYPAELISEISDTYSITSITNSISLLDSGSTKAINSPSIEPISGTGKWGGHGVGSDNLTEYSDQLIISSNESSIQLPFSATNISESGYTEIKLELFEQSGSSLIFSEEEYSILNVIAEYDDFGVYKLSYVSNLENGDYININSSYVPYLNQTVKIESVNYSNNEIKTYPKIGLFYLPMGENGSGINWQNYINSGILGKLYACYSNAHQSYNGLINLCQLWSQVNLNDPQYQDIWEGIISDNIEFTPDINQYKINRSITIAIMSDIIDYPVEYAFASILILEFLKINPNYSLNSNYYQLINRVTESHTRAKFNKIISFYNWATPRQIKKFDNDGYQSLETITWGLPTMNMAALTENTISLSGGITFGGIDSLNQPILKDKNEYFYRVQLSTSAPLSWGDQEGIDNYSGHDLISTGYKKQILNDITYYGRNFTFFRKANEPIIETAPLDANGYYAPYRMMQTTAALVTFNGVGDSDRLEIHYLPMTGLTTYGLRQSTYTDQLNSFQFTGDTGGTYVLSGWQSYSNIYGYEVSGYYDELPADWTGFTDWVDYWEGGGDSGNYWKENLGPGSGYSGWISSSQIALEPDAWWTGYTSVHYVGTIDGGEYSSYLSLTENLWTRSGITVPIIVQDYADDGYLYTNESVLEPYTAYWWRIANYRNKKNLFGINLEIFNTTEPRIVVTGPWDGTNSSDGEIDTEPAAPDPGPPGPRDGTIFEES